jgi:hypothetical protein
MGLPTEADKVSEDNPFKRMLDSLKSSDGRIDMAAAARLWKEGGAGARPVSWQGVLSKDEFMERFQPFARQSTFVGTRLAHAAKVALAVVTIGVELERSAGNYRERGRNIAGKVLDGAGKLLVEAELRRVLAKIGFHWGGRGYSPGPSFRPGDGDFSIQAEAVFVSLAGTALGLSMSADGHLLPRMTKTVIVGLQRDGR